MTKLCKECNEQDCENTGSKGFGWCNKPCEGDLPPSPPGDTIRDLLKERSISKRAGAHRLNISDLNMEKLLKGDFLIDNDMACRLSEVFGSTPDFWENRERQYRDAFEIWKHPSTKGGDR